ncbi:hypothetical protein [Selenomonas sp. FC4001]|uniref:hypothetical protein n=1 Tax=Selenomonas sp. FC4001 TaxID=1408313 RepID=UPI00055A7473|nr:hypothetical protein [Selenomonas sp. FC4001]
MEQGEQRIQEALEALLKEDRQILGRKDELIEKLEPKLEGVDQRYINALKKAFQQHDIGELLLAADQGPEEDQEKARIDAEERLKSGNMQEKRIDSVMSILIGALRWGVEEEESTEESESETMEDHALLQEPQTWDCYCGKSENKGPFCTACGKTQAESEAAVKRAAEESTIAGWTCGQCGRQGNKGKFCAGCGAPQKENKPAESQPVTPPRPQIPPMPQTPVMQPTATGSGTNGTQRVIIGVIAVLFIVLAGICFKEFSAGSDTSAASSYRSLTKNPDSSKEKGKPQLVAKTDLSLGGVDLDISLDDLHSKLGKEKSHENGKEGHVFYFYDGMKVGTKGGVVTSFVSDGAACSTKRGIHEGSTLQEVIDAYGSDAMKTNYEGLVLYEYNFKSLTGNDGILRFAINGQNKVDYISVRIPEAPKVDTQAVGNAAKNVVASYHKYITNRDYRSAYNLLNDNMQNTMGSYDNWTRGFANTIESRVTDLQVSDVQADRAEVSFILVARDRRPGGYEENRFRSTATVVKDGGAWKIAAVNNKKI